MTLLADNNEYIECARCVRTHFVYHMRKMTRRAVECLTYELT